jgi:hypothetical protein
VVRTRRDDDVLRADRAGGGLEFEPACVACRERRHARGPQRNLRGIGVPLEVVDRLVPGEERLGIVSGVLAAGEPKPVVRRVEPEAVPAARAPGLAYPALFEDDVLAADL